jgi:hypothetical protein
MTAGIADRGGDDTRDATKLLLDAPEASCRERRELATGTRRERSPSSNMARIGPYLRHFHLLLGCVSALRTVFVTLDSVKIRGALPRIRSSRRQLNFSFSRIVTAFGCGASAHSPKHLELPEA